MFHGLISMALVLTNTLLSLPGNNNKTDFAPYLLMLFEQKNPALPDF